VRLAASDRNTDQPRRVDLIIKAHGTAGGGGAGISAADDGIAVERLHAAETAGPHPPIPRLIGQRWCLQRLEGGRCRLLLLGGVGERRFTVGDALAIGGLAAAPERALIHHQGIEYAAAGKGGVLRRRRPFA
jgi:hypothetical protein